MNKTLWLIILVILSVSTILSAGDLPNGWQKDKKVLTFHANDLYGRINGGAELFLEFGFDRLEVHLFTNQDDEIEIEIFRMQTPESALGIYIANCGSETPLEGVNARNSGGKYQILALKGSVLMKVNSYSGNEAYLPAMIQLANYHLKDIKAADASKIFDVLPKENLIKNSERLIRGPYGLQPIFTFGDGDILQLNGEIFGVVADYETSDTTTCTRIIITYPGEKSAKSAYDNIINNLDRYIEIIHEFKTGFAFKDYSKKYGSVRLKTTQIDIHINLTNSPVIPRH